MKFYSKVMSVCGTIHLLFAIGFIQSFSLAFAANLPSSSEDEFEASFRALVDFSNESVDTVAQQGRFPGTTQETLQIQRRIGRLEQLMRPLWLSATGVPFVANVNAPFPEKGRSESYCSYSCRWIAPVTDTGSAALRVYLSFSYWAHSQFGRYLDLEDPVSWNPGISYLEEQNAEQGDEQTVTLVVEFFKKVQNLAERMRNQEKDLASYLRWDRLSLQPRQQLLFLRSPQVDQVEMGAYRPMVNLDSDNRKYNNPLRYRYEENPQALIFEESRKSEDGALNLMKSILAFMLSVDVAPYGESFQLLHTDTDFFFSSAFYHAGVVSPFWAFQRKGGLIDPGQQPAYRAAVQILEAHIREAEWMNPVWPRLHSMLGLLRRMNLPWQKSLEELIEQSLSESLMRDRLPTGSGQKPVRSFFFKFKSKRLVSTGLSGQSRQRHRLWAIGSV